MQGKSRAKAAYSRLYKNQKHVTHYKSTVYNTLSVYGKILENTRY